MSEGKIIIPGSDRQLKPLSPPQFVNKLSWINIGNKDEDQQRRFVEEVAKYRKDLIYYGMSISAKIANESEACCGEGERISNLILTAAKEFKL